MSLQILLFYPPIFVSFFFLLQVKFRSINCFVMPECAFKQLSLMSNVIVIDSIQVILSVPPLFLCF